MTGKDIVLLFSTFFMGIFAGAYLYVSVFATSYEDILNGDILASDAFTIEGTMYGSCDADGLCASFQLVEGKEYTYLAYSEATVKKGTLPAGFRAALKSALTEESLQQNAKLSAQTQCSSAYGGVDYTYTISKDGKDYLLDTCATQLSADYALQDLFEKIWIAFEDENVEAPQAELPSFDLQNVADFVFDRFHNGPQSQQ